ncbi:MAG: hypothetical protein KC620_22930, partial [Myxococcales bacterium]|nr:hypothetical protein [Myxococcales bacterium]
MLLVALALVLVLLGAAWFLWPPLLEHAIAARLEAAAVARGVDLRWGELQVDPGGVTMLDVRARHARGWLRAAELRVDVSIWAAVQGEARVTAVQLVRPEAQLSLAEAPPPASTPARGSRGEGLLARLRQDPPEVTLVAPRLTVLDAAGAPFAEASGESFVFTPADAGFTLTGEGHAEVRSIGRVEARVEGALTFAGAVALRLAGGRGPLFAGDLPQGVTARVEGAELTVD